MGNFPFCEFGEKSILSFSFGRGVGVLVYKWFEGVLADHLEPEKEGSPRANHSFHLLPLIHTNKR